MGSKPRFTLLYWLAVQSQTTRRRASSPHLGLPPHLIHPSVLGIFFSYLLLRDHICSFTRRRSLLRPLLRPPPAFRYRKSYRLVSDLPNLIPHFSIPFFDILLPSTGLVEASPLWLSGFLFVELSQKVTSVFLSVIRRVGSGSFWGNFMKPFGSACFVFLSYSFSSVLHCIASKIEGLTGNFCFRGCALLLHRAPPIPVSEERPYTTSFLYRVQVLSFSRGVSKIRIKINCVGRSS